MAIECKNYDKNTKIKHTKEVLGEFILDKIFEQNNTHITITLPNLLIHGGFFDRAEKLLSEQLSSLLPEGDGTVLVIGLGNREITPDAIGPLTMGRVIATRHISGELAKQMNLPQLHSVAVIAPSVLGTTGIEVAEIAAALNGALNPRAIIVVDALCAADIKRLRSEEHMNSSHAT